jgi:2-amino-4-hydroxy-6-hydroxymethyldihydropteridine diphosphokinase
LIENILVENGPVILVAIGSNLPGRHGRSEDLLDAALDRFPDFGLTVIHRSSWWRSAAWPDPCQPAYTNAVVLVETGLNACALLAVLQAIEQLFDRRRERPNEPRTLDLDLVAYGSQRSETPELTIPHPRAHLRRFVMGPLAEILPGWIHPTLGVSARDLLESATVGLDAHRI